MFCNKSNFIQYILFTCLLQWLLFMVRYDICGIILVCKIFGKLHIFTFHIFRLQMLDLYSTIWKFWFILYNSIKIEGQMTNWNENLPHITNIINIKRKILEGHIFCRQVSNGHQQSIHQEKDLNIFVTIWKTSISLKVERRKINRNKILCGNANNEAVTLLIENHYFKN